MTDLASGRPIELRGGGSAIEVQERGVLLALSDGMGGHQAGEVASSMVLESLRTALCADTDGPLHQQLEHGVKTANRTVKSAARTRARHKMGATLTAVLVHGSEAYIAEVGDSRAYLLRNGRLRQITRDQSLIQTLIDGGVMTAEQARRSPNKNVILQAVGLSNDVSVALARLALRRQDRLLLCSDGVSNALSDEELRQIMLRGEPHAACEKMIELANARGGDDNQTAIVADLTGDELDPADEFESVTSTYEVLQAFEAAFRGRPVTNDDVRALAEAGGLGPFAAFDDSLPDDPFAEDSTGDRPPMDDAPAPSPGGDAGEPVVEKILVVQPAGKAAARAATGTAMTTAASRRRVLTIAVIAAIACVTIALALAVATGWMT